jgi:hypothetical protein
VRWTVGRFFAQPYLPSISISIIENIKEKNTIKVENISQCV